MEKIIFYIINIILCLSLAIVVNQLFGEKIIISSIIAIPICITCILVYVFKTK